MFIERLNQLLKERNLTRSKFLSDLNMGKNQFKYWETRGTPNTATVNLCHNRYHSLKPKRFGFDFRQNKHTNFSKNTAEELTSFAVFLFYPVPGNPPLGAGLSLHKVGKIRTPLFSFSDFMQTFRF